MSAYFAIVSKAPAAQELVLCDGPPFTSYVFAGVKDWGNPAWSHQFSGAIGTQGRRPASGVPQDREYRAGFMTADHADKDELAATLSAVTSVMDEIRRFGGWITFREHTQTVTQQIEVSVGAMEVTGWDTNRFDVRNESGFTLSFTGGPYLVGPSMDIADDFSSDTLAAGDYAAEAGDLANLQVTGGQLAPVANLTTENRLIHVGNGYVYSDVEVTLRVTVGATVTGFKAGVVMKAADTDNRVEVYLDDNGTISRLNFKDVVAGAASTTTLSIGGRVSAGQTFWIRAWAQGGRVTGCYFTTDPELQGPEMTGAFSSSIATNHGWGDRGRVGLVFTPQAAGARLDDFRVRTYPGKPSLTLANNVPVFRHDGPVPGDAPALGEIEMQTASSSSASSPFGLFAWWRRPTAHNLIPHGDFDTSGARWSVAAVSGFSGAATSVTRTSSADSKHGNYVGVVVTPATSGTGAKFRTVGQFLLGETYTARAWVRAPSSTTQVRLRLGTGSDNAASSAVALTTSWQELTVTWTPTADAAIVYVGVEVAAATATTFHLDGVQLYLGDSAPSGMHAQGAGAFPPFGIIEAENYTGVTTFTETASSSYSGQTALTTGNVSAGGGVGSADFLIDPALCLPDDYSGGAVSIVVWAKVFLSTAFSGGVQAWLLAQPEGYAGAEPIYSSEHGNIGVTLPRAVGSSGWRYARLCTLTLPFSRSARSRWYITTTFTIAAGTNNAPLMLDFLALVPARGHVCSPTAKPTSEYPSFLPSTGLRKRVIYSDGTSELAVGAGAALGAASGFGGVIELPPGNLETMAIISRAIPDDPAGATVASAAEERVYARLSVRPRWSYLREGP